MRFVWRRESRLLEIYETHLCRRFDHILTVTDEDRVALTLILSQSEAAAFQAKTTSIPICIDPGDRPLLPAVGDTPQILHLGTMFWPPNVEGVLWFTQEVMPLVWQRVPAARLVIGGKDPTPEIRALAAKDGAAGPSVEVTGYVEDPEPLLQRSQVFIVPVRAGGGMRVKILDGWLAGVPVVSTTVGAEGIDIRTGENILLADSAVDFAAAVIDLLEDRSLRERLRDNGRRWVEARYDWRKRYPEVEAIYLRLMGGRSDG
jgi:glycosyltransferase involved in cell wall biosynthesis